MLLPTPSANMLRSQTEPSTPLRNIVHANPDLANYSAPLRLRLSAIHLPPQELLQVLNDMSLRRSSTTRERPPSRHSGPSSRRNSVGRSRPTSSSRRLSDNLTIRRRKRSSTGLYYDSGYVGPVTKGFLRAFSRALLQDNKDDTPEEVVYKALDEQPRRRLTSPAELINEFDYSLPLPSDDIMMSPYQPSRPTDALDVKPKPEKPVFKSYLERILENSNKHQVQLLSMFDGDSPRDLTSHGVNAALDTSNFVIENTLSGLPEYSNIDDMHSLDLRLAEPVAFGNLSDASDSNFSSENENIQPVPALSARRSTFLDDVIVTPNEYGEFPQGEINQLDIPRWDSVLTSKMVTPNLNFGRFEVNDDEKNVGSDLSSDGLIAGHFTIDNEEIQDHEFYLQPDIGNEQEEARTPSLILEEPSEIIAKRRTSLGPSLVSKRRFPTQERALPRSLVRGIVSVALNVSALGGNQSPPRKKPKIKRISPSLMQSITLKSNEFLQQVMLDLGAYAGHRNSSQINIQDVVLYLNRIKSYGPSRSTIDNISALAQSVFPLELLVSLDNSLQESANKRLGNRRRNKENDSDVLIYSIPSLETSPESNSPKTDEDLSDLEWD